MYRVVLPQLLFMPHGSTLEGVKPVLSSQYVSSKTLKKLLVFAVFAPIT